MDTGTNRSHLKTAALIAVWLAVLAALLWYRHHRHVNPDYQLHYTRCIADDITDCPPPPHCEEGFEFRDTIYDCTRKLSK